MRDLGDDATAINQRGQVIGSEVSKGAGRAFIWEHGTVTYLPWLGGTRGAAALNERGQVVGYGQTKNEATHAVLWTLKR